MQHKALCHYVNQPHQLTIYVPFNHFPNPQVKNLCEHQIVIKTVGMAKITQVIALEQRYMYVYMYILDPNFLKGVEQFCPNAYI